MSNKPFKVFPDAMQTVDLLSDVEAGRLFKALIHHVNGLNDDLPGKELLVYTMMAAQIDRDAASSDDYHQQRQEAGKKGGRPRKETSEKVQKGTFSEKKVENLDIDNDIDIDYDKDNDVEVDVDKDRAREVSAAAPAFDSPDFKADLTSPITYAVNELGHLSPLDLQALASFRDELPDDVIIYGINAACSANVRTWAYARSILNRYVSAGFKSVGDIKAAEAKREAQKAQMVSDGHGGKIANPALNFQQRDNSEFSAEVDNSWMSEFMPGGAAQ